MRTYIDALLLVGAIVWSEALAGPTTVNDSTQPGWSINFYYTVDGNPVNGGRVRTRTGGGNWSAWGGYNNQYNNTNGTGHRRAYQFEPRPQDLDRVTDWRQEIYWRDPLSGVVKKSDVYNANIHRTQRGPWDFSPLIELPELDWRIPDLGPEGAASPDATIYTAVHFGLYLQNNPVGFLDGVWHAGQSLGDLNLSIVNGTMNGVQGIYWATTPFVFDPDPAGVGFTPSGGMSTLLNSATYGQAILIFEEHTPEAASMLLLLVAALWMRRR